MLNPELITRMWSIRIKVYLTIDGDTIYFLFNPRLYSLTFDLWPSVDDTNLGTLTLKGFNLKLWADSWMTEEEEPHRTSTRSLGHTGNLRFRGNTRFFDMTSSDFTAWTNCETWLTFPLRSRHITSSGYLFQLRMRSTFLKNWCYWSFPFGRKTRSWTQNDLNSFLFES